MALGWPVRENGPDPGFPICPVAKCRWISAAFLAVPLLDWFRPMVYRDSAEPALPNQCAHWMMSAAGTPQISSAALGVNSCMRRSEEHTSELQSLMRISYAVFCLKKTIQR